MADYARRLAETVDRSSPFLLGGVSLGGMIAQEMAQVLKPAALLLIATCQSSESLPKFWQISGRLIHHSPNWLVKLISHTASLMALACPASKFPHKRLYAQMLKEMPPSLLRWQCGAATSWRLSVPPTMPVFRLHGAKDIVIPLEKVNMNGADCTVISDSGHFVSVMRAKQVNAWILDCMKRFSQ